MIDKMVQALVKNKHFVVIAIAALVMFAYAVPYGIDVEAKEGFLKDKYGNAYGIQKFGTPPHTGGIHNGPP